MLELSWSLILRFANDRKLGGLCRSCELSGGEPVVHLSDKSVPVGLGHTFTFTARIETAEDVFC